MLETEVEWRRRLSLLEAQRILLDAFRDANDVTIEQYRLRFHCNFQRRLGTRRTMVTFAFNTKREFLALMGSSLDNREIVTSNEELLASIKHTNCFHAKFFYDERYTLQENTRFPRVFACKRAVELDDTRPASNSLDEWESAENDRSDNNLGLRFYTKIHRTNSESVRTCLYSILDEFGSVRYELGVETELVDDTAMLRCSTVIHSLAQHLDFCERPCINVQSEWIPGNCPAVVVKSLACPAHVVSHVQHWIEYALRAIRSSVMVKLKIDGVRAYGVFDGHRRMILSNGAELDIDGEVADSLSASFVYQIEIVDDTTYYICEVLALRNDYVHGFVPPLHTFAASDQRYRKHPGQEWPYGLVGVTISEQQVEALCEARKNSCLHGQNSREDEDESRSMLDDKFVPIRRLESEAMLQALDNRFPSAVFRVNAALRPDEIDESFVADMFVAALRRMANLCTHEDDQPLLSRLHDLTYRTTTKQHRDNATVKKDQVPIDGLLLFREGKTHAENKCAFKSTPDLIACKLKPFQTIELLRSGRYLKTASFYRSYYFAKKDDGSWSRFDQVPVDVYVPRLFRPLLENMVYELACVDATTFVMIAERQDKTVPDTTVKVNSIVFRRETLCSEGEDEN